MSEFSKESFLKKALQMANSRTFSQEIIDAITLDNVEMFLNLEPRKMCWNLDRKLHKDYSANLLKLRNLNTSYELMKKKVDFFSRSSQKKKLKNMKSEINTLSSKINKYRNSPTYRIHKRDFSQNANAFLEFLTIIIGKETETDNYIYDIIPKVYHRLSHITYLDEYVGGTEFTINGEELTYDELKEKISEKYDIPEKYLDINGYFYPHAYYESISNPFNRGKYIMNLVNNKWKSYMQTKTGKAKYMKIYVTCSATMYHMTIKEKDMEKEDMKNEIAELKTEIKRLRQNLEKK